jgi:hypothetical protein
MSGLRPVPAASLTPQQIGEVVPVVGKLAVGPQHAAGLFVAHLHHVRQHAGIAEGVDGVARVRVDRIHQLLVLQLLPRNRSDLMRRVGPVVGVVEVEQKSEAQRLGLLRFGDGVREIIGQLVWRVFRRVEEAQPHPAVTVTAQNLQSLRGFAVVFEDRSVRLGLGKKRDIRADRKPRTLGSRRLCKCHRAPCGEQQSRA